MRAFITICLFLIALLSVTPSIEAQSTKQPYQQRMELYKTIEAMWEFIND